jgi:hypothetical protein
MKAGVYPLILHMGLPNAAVDSAPLDLNAGFNLNNHVLSVYDENTPPEIFSDGSPWRSSRLFGIDAHGL